MSEIPIEGLPEGLRAVRFGQPKPGEHVWQGFGIQRSPYGRIAALIVEPAEGYEFLYDVLLDQWDVAKVPWPFPQPHSADWLDFAGELLHTLLKVPCRFIPDLFTVNQINDSTRHNRLAYTHAFSMPIAVEVQCCVEDAMAGMAARLNAEAASAGTVITGELPVPKGTADARFEVRHGVGLRYVRARDLALGWVMRFDLLYQISKENQS